MSSGVAVCLAAKAILRALDHAGDGSEWGMPTVERAAKPLYEPVYALIAEWGTLATA